MKLPMNVLASAIGLALGLPLSPTHASMGGGAPAPVWTPAQWFLASEQGIWLAPDDFTRYIGEKGPELVTNGDFSGGATGWTLGSTWAISGGVATVNNPGSFAALVSNAAVVIGKWYEMTFTVVSISAGSIAVRLGAGGFGSTVTAAGTYTSRVQCLTSAAAYLQAAAGTIATVDNISVRELTAINTATMFQDSAGTTPVTAVEQPVGLALDKRLGLVRGPEATLATTAVKTVDGTQFTDLYVGTGADTGKWYEINLLLNSRSGDALSVSSAGGGTTAVLTTIGANRFFILKGTGSIRIGGVTTSRFDVSGISLKALPGNHAYQPTTAQKPVLSARKNLFTYSEDFTNGVWLKGANAAVTGNTIAAPNGSMTADTYTSSGAADALYANVTGLGANAPGAVLIRVKQGTGRWLKLEVGSNGYRCWIDTQTSTVGASATFGAGGTLINASVTPLADGWMDVKLAGTIPGTTAYVQLNSVTGNSSTTQASGTYYVWGAHYETGSSNVAAYQRVTTNTDYDTVGFPYYAKSDRVDDNWTVASGGGGTTGIIVCAAIRASGAGNARTIWSDRGTNTGYLLGINASNQLVLSAGNGTAYTEVVGPTITAGTDYVVTGWHDGTNLNVRVNAGATTSAAFGTATAGTAGFTIGKDNGAATGYYGERIYEIVYRKNDASTAGDRTSLITYMAAQAGITL